MTGRIGLIACLVAVALIASCSERGPRVVDAWIRPSPASADVVAVYVTLELPAPDVMTAVDAADCGVLEFHQTVMDGDVMQMRPVELPFAVADGLVMTPGGMHLMCIDPVAVPVEGEELEVQLLFEQAGEIRVDAEVVDR